MLVCAFLCASGTRDRGCSAHPAFPAPSFREGEMVTQTSGDCAARTRTHVSLRCHAPRRRGIAAASRFYRWRLWNTGSPVEPGDDEWRGCLKFESETAPAAISCRSPRACSRVQPKYFSANNTGYRHTPQRGRRRSAPPAAAVLRSARRPPPSAWRGGGGKR
jgi:hypothetical protein